jgi:hypothetical protein
MQYKNALLDDQDLQETLKLINGKFGNFSTPVAGEAWGLPLIDQKTQALITGAKHTLAHNSSKGSVRGYTGERTLILSIKTR